MFHRSSFVELQLKVENTVLPQAPYPPGDGSATCTRTPCPAIGALITLDGLVWDIFHGESAGLVRRLTPLTRLRLADTQTVAEKGE